MQGTANRDLILGLASNDAIAGGGGDDSLVGGVGKDAVSGGTGNDRFIYNQKRGKLFYDSNGIGSKKQLEITTCGSKPGLVANDILDVELPF